MVSSSSSLHFLIIFLAFSFVLFVSESRSFFKPNNLVLPVRKDCETNLHVAYIYKSQTPLLQLLVDLNGQFSWVNCETNNLSSTSQAPRCHSTQCARANSHYCVTCSSNASPGCRNNTCGLISTNPVSHQSAMGVLAEGALSFQSIKYGSNPGPIVPVSQFLFVCAPSRLLQTAGFPKFVPGVVGLGHAPIALPTQLASHFGFRSKFSLCLASTSTSRNLGAIFFGEGPIYMLRGIDVSSKLQYTPLLISRQGEYFIQVTSIRINRITVPSDPSLLRVTQGGTGGTMISTTTPYTVLEHSIYQSFTKCFTQLLSIPQVQPVGPFKICYDSKKFPSTIVGPRVPKIDLVFSNPSAVWTIIGANSMVQALPGVTCLGFVDGGLNPRASIVIGARQLEDNLVQFDLARSMLGFSSSLLFQRTNCANFNFTLTPRP